MHRCVHLSKLMHSRMRHTVLPEDRHHNNPPHTSYKVPWAFAQQGVGSVSLLLDGEWPL